MYYQASLIVEVIFLIFELMVQLTMRLCYLINIFGLHLCKLKIKRGKKVKLGKWFCGRKNEKLEEITKVNWLTPICTNKVFIIIQRGRVKENKYWSFRILYLSWGCLKNLLVINSFIISYCFITYYNLSYYFFVIERTHPPYVLNLIRARSLRWKN